MKLSEVLTNEINATEAVEPNVLMFVDQSAIFWVTNDGYYVWLQDHRGINDYIDETNQEEERRYTDKNIEGVSNSGVYWMNEDLESPYHISDFQKRIDQINVNA